VRTGRHGDDCDFVVKMRSKRSSCAAQRSTPSCALRRCSTEDQNHKGIAHTSAGLHASDLYWARNRSGTCLGRGGSSRASRYEKTTRYTSGTVPRVETSTMRRNGSLSQNPDTSRIASRLRGMGLKARRGSTCKTSLDRMRSAFGSWSMIRVLISPGEFAL
jgi:hypothetical protein